MKTRIVLFVAGAGIVLVAAMLWHFGGQVKERNAQRIEAAKDKPTSADSEQVIGGGTVSFRTTAPTPPSGAKPVVNQPPADPSFQKWIAQEAKDVDKVHVDSASKKAEMAKVIAELTPSKTHQLLQTAENPGAPAGERILSTYLLAEAGTATQAELKQLITAPMQTDMANAKAHSEAEMKGMQERSLRVMAIDGLLSRAEHDPGARTVLNQAIGEIQDPYIRSYAQKHLAELKP